MDADVGVIVFGLDSEYCCCLDDVSDLNFGSLSIIFSGFCANSLSNFGSYISLWASNELRGEGR